MMRPPEILIPGIAERKKGFNMYVQVPERK